MNAQKGEEIFEARIFRKHNSLGEQHSSIIERNQVEVFKILSSTVEQINFNGGLD